MADLNIRRLMKRAFDGHSHESEQVEMSAADGKWQWTVCKKCHLVADGQKRAFTFYVPRKGVIVQLKGEIVQVK